MRLADRIRRAFSTSASTNLDMVTDEDIEQLYPGEIAPAAVLVPIIDAAEPRLLLTVRHAGMRKHAGQVAFPGGRIDHDDDGPIAAALREAEEEVGLPRAQVEVIGPAGRYRTGTGYDITPILAVIPEGLVLVPHEAEVAEIFEVPLAHLFDQANHVRRQEQWGTGHRQFYEIMWGDYRIWGATAGLIVNLSKRLEAL